MLKRIWIHKILKIKIINIINKSVKFLIITIIRIFQNLPKKRRLLRYQNKKILNSFFLIPKKPKLLITINFRLQNIIMLYLLTIILIIILLFLTFRILFYIYKTEFALARVRLPFFLPSFILQISLKILFSFLLQNIQILYFLRIFMY